MHDTKLCWAEAALRVAALARRISDLTERLRREAKVNRYDPAAASELWAVCLEHERAAREVRRLVMETVPVATPPVLADGTGVHRRVEERSRRDSSTVTMEAPPLPPAGDPLYDLGDAGLAVVQYVAHEEQTARHGRPRPRGRRL